MSQNSRSQTYSVAAESSQRTVTATRQKLASSTGTAASFDHELLVRYAHLRRSAVMIVAPIAAALATIVWFWIPSPVVLIWAGLVIASHAVLTLIAIRFLKISESEFKVRQWSAVFTSAELAHGLSWSIIGASAILVQSNQIPIILFIIQLVSLASNMMATRVLPPATLAATTPTTVVVTVLLFMSSDPLYQVLACVGFFMQLFIVFLGRTMLKSELHNMMQRSELDAVIGELAEASYNSEDARRQAEQANVAKSRFLAAVSHELRTPLNAIIGFSEVMKSELLGKHEIAQYKEYSQDILTSGQHLLQLINDLLDLSRIEAGKYDLNEEPLHINDVAQDCLSMVQIRADAKNIKIECELNSSLSKLWADERAVRQVILNLMSNAIKFTPASGQIVMTSGWTKSGGQYLSVKDNGPGIGEDEMDTVMSSFGQGELARKTAEQGAGLGLPIVKNIMTLHNGDLRLTSKLREGTLATISFPKSRAMDSVGKARSKRSIIA